MVHYNTVETFRKDKIHRFQPCALTHITLVKNISKQIGCINELQWAYCPMNMIQYWPQLIVSYLYFFLAYLHFSNLESMQWMAPIPWAVLYCYNSCSGITTCFMVVTKWSTIPHSWATIVNDKQPQRVLLKSPMLVKVELLWRWAGGWVDGRGRNQRLGQGGVCVKQQLCQCLDPSLSPPIISKATSRPLKQMFPLLQGDFCSSKLPMQYNSSVQGSC